MQKQENTTAAQIHLEKCSKSAYDNLNDVLGCPSAAPAAPCGPVPGWPPALPGLPPALFLAPPALPPAPPGQPLRLQELRLLPPGRLCGLPWPGQGQLSLLARTGRLPAGALHSTGQVTAHRLPPQVRLPSSLPLLSPSPSPPPLFSPLHQRCKKTTFLHEQGLSQNNFTQKKCVNYDKSNSRQNSVKGPKDPVSAKKCQKVTKSFKMCIKCHQKAQNRDITNFLDKTA